MRFIIKALRSVEAQGPGPAASLVRTHPALYRRKQRASATAAGSVTMLVATTETVAAHRTVETKGQCFGVVVRSRGLGGNIMAGLRSIVGGEITEYTQLLEEARRHAVDRMVRNASL